MRIHKLSELVVSQIAAGEVIESPAGAVKEVLENAIDAKASAIDIFIRGGGLESIQIRDNGGGIVKEDLPLALDSFATSKIEKLDDLYGVRSMGFRGEALSSIQSVSKLTIESKSSEAQAEKNGWKITAEGGAVSEIEACPFDGSGARILIENLFYNVPIRKKFLANENTIRRQIQEVISSYALAFPEIAFTYAQDGKETFRFAKAPNLLERISMVWGSDFPQRLLPVFSQGEGFSLEGYISGLDFFHSHAGFSKLFVDRRKIYYKQLTPLLRRAYGELMPPGKYPAALLFLNIDSDIIDVNVHPQKKEVKFKNPSEMETFIFKALKTAIEGERVIPSSHFIKTSRKIQSYHQESKNTPVQEELNLHMPPAVKEGDPLYGGAEPVDAGGEFHDSVGNHDDGQSQSQRQPMPQVIHTTLFGTIILASAPEGVYLIDQHTAHERIRYEEILAKLENNTPAPQPIAGSVVFYPSTDKKELLMENEALLNSLGFDTEDMGPAGFRLLSVPSYVRPGDEEHSITLALTLLEKNSRVSPPELFDKLAKSMACRSAIKKGESASTYELGKLVEKLYQCKEPARCPHGRPTVIFMGKNDLFSFFKRQA